MEETKKEIEFRIVPVDFKAKIYWTWKIWRGGSIKVKARREEEEQNESGKQEL